MAVEPQVKANAQQNTPSADDLDAKIEQDRVDLKANYPIDNNHSLEAEELEEDKPQEAQEKKRGSPRKAEPEEEVQEEEVEKDTSEEEVDTKEESDVVDQEDEDRRKRIEVLAYEKRELNRQLRAMQEEVARLKGNKPPEDPAEEDKRRIQEAAEKIYTERRFLEKCEIVANAGRKEFADFDKTLSNLNQNVGFPNHVIEAVLETDAPTKVINYLGKNLDEAERVFGMKPIQMAVALSKMASKINAPPIPKPQSKAPPPIKPLNGNAKAEPSLENLSIEDFIRKEDEREAKRRYSRT